MSYTFSDIRQLRSNANRLKPFTAHAYDAMRDTAISHYFPHRTDTTKNAEAQLYHVALGNNQGYLETVLYGEVWTDLLPNEQLAIEHLYYENPRLVDVSTAFYSQIHAYVEAKLAKKENTKQHLIYALWEVLHNSLPETDNVLEHDKAVRRRRAQAEMLNTFGILLNEIPTPDYIIQPIREHFQRMPLEQLLPEIAFPLKVIAKTIADEIQWINADMHTALLGQKSDISQSHTIPEATEAFSSVYARTIEDGATTMLEAELAKLGTQGKNATQIMEHMELARAFYQDTTIPYRIDMLATHFNGKLSEIRQADSDISHYVWTTADDEKVRSAHAENDEKIFAWDSPPETGHPGEDYNCRCIARPILTRSQEEIEVLLREDAIEPVYPEFYVISGVAARRILARATADMDNALARIFQDRIAKRFNGIPKNWKK
ncbi:MAG: minor capsid protein [Alphaproteobacteria bacterium]|nr:minor capsid protein [Alphaproteobacteria bacterium]